MFKVRTYFPEHYLADLRTADLGILCGLTMTKILNKSEIENYISPVNLICCLYDLNLLSQSIYTYFPAVHPIWIASSAPFIDCRCDHYHGGVNYPSGILEYVSQPTGCPDLVSLEISSDVLIEHNRFFFLEYMPDIIAKCSAMVRREFDPRDLLEKIKQDPDAEEFQIEEANRESTE
jgi:hypothetical protein